MKTLSIVINVRLNSTRIKHKMIRPFCQTNLLDLALSKFRSLNIDKYLAFCLSEKEIAEICQNYEFDYKFIQRDESSVLKGSSDQMVSFRHYKQIPTTHILWVNPCAPFLKTKTISSAADLFMENNFETMTSVKSINNIVFDSNFKPVNTNSLRVSTQGNGPMYEMAHLFHIFDREEFLNRGLFWNYTENNPYFYLVSDHKECLDIDEPLDFDICEALYLVENNCPNM